ncbi:MAG: hypothetical protein ACR2IF_04980 [Terriglobales bacterium]
MKNRILRPARLMVALTVVALALATFAHADAASRKTKGKLNITAPTEVAGITLSPGYYEVKEINSASGTLLRFTRVTENLSAQEGQPIYEWEKVAEVRVTAEPLTASATRTGFLLAAEANRAVGLEIRGNNMDYHFEGE